MKFFVALSFAFISQFAFANTTDTASVFYQGQSNIEQVQLSTQKTHTEYREVEVRTTCYRTDYRYQCTTQPPMCRTECRNGQCRRICSGPPRRICRNIPVQVPYSCTRIERQPYQVFDYYVDSNIEFNFEGDVTSAAETFKVTQRGEEVSVNVAASNRYALVLKDTMRSEEMSGNTKFLDIRYFIELVDLANAKEALRNGLREIKLTQNVLTFRAGKGYAVEDFTKHLKLYQSRVIGSDTLLLDRQLADHEITIEEQASDSLVTIDLNQFGINLPNRLKVIFETEYALAGRGLMNQDSVSNLSANFNYLFKR